MNNNSKNLITNSNNYNISFQDNLFTIFSKYLLIINEFLKHSHENIYIKNQGYRDFILKQGIITLTHVFKILLMYTKNLDIGKIKKNFITNSSCGVCGKTSLDSIEVLKTNKIDLSFPKINYNIILKSPELLQNNQSEFSKTGGIHASGLFTAKGDIVAIKEDVGRHNALDKLIGHALDQKLLNTNSQFLTCSGRLNFDLVQKALMANIGVLIGVGAPTSLAIDLANRFDMTLVGFVKGDSFNIYSSSERIK